ncbi:response regulator transcription factor [Asticcacaulis solisilvae]|uniref:response regulator transcription factor n=1 Tax=Asticcacaulis solisilvae TaxID=1217274 RepID=UPI003FD7C138
MNEQASRVEALSERQKEILRLIAQHLQAKEVARVLDISESTVKTHTDAARRRLGVASSRDAAKLLVAYEAKGAAEGGILPEGGWSPRPMAEPAAPVTVSGHEHALSPERTIFPGPLERPRDRLADAGYAGQAGPDRGYAPYAADAGQERWQREGDLYHGRGDSLADGRWGGFERWLKSLSTVQWLGLILLAGFLIMLATGGMIEAAVGTMQAIKELRHQAG